MSPAENVLEIENLNVVFGGEDHEVTAVESVSLSLRAGEALALVGESGSGKSTVGFATIGLLPGNARTTGRIMVGGTETTGADEKAMRALRGNEIGMVFQEPATALNPLRRVGDQIAEVIRNHREVTRAQARAEAVQLLERVGIPQPQTRSRAFPFQLSGGQRQRVVIAMAIANRPRLLIADEPTTALDVTVQAEILDLLRDLAKDSGTGVLLITHNMGVVADFADTVAVMHQGRIVETGTVRKVLTDPAAAYTQKLLAAVPRLRTEASDEIRPSKPETEAVLSVEKLNVVYGRGPGAVHALKDVSFTVRAGQTLGIVGESGSGKSTAARVALGLIKPRSGSVELFGQELRAGRGGRALRAGIGVVLQDPASSLDPRMTVAQAIAEPLHIHRRSLSRSDLDTAVKEALEQVNLAPSLASRAPQELSGGQRQRVSLARALILKPRLLIADEPTSALDVSVQQSVLEVVAELQAELGFACVFVSHDLAVVQRVAQQVLVMRSGEVVETGPTERTLLYPETDYTRRLLDAVPVPDPDQQKIRRQARLTLAAGA
ncbi:ABC transporter ATP-binding protein [Kineosporia babensis]|uniref:ABC transporter ATP-binding protein n=1 Tax=Kineosporia babensis TaxID=499548 RepID=A0A9X1NHG6_9ACTN|nr:ABC transporter ATP-binding protein [Kineosporia babensis]MCD5313949.1 ABC transporter ATP-binding protein [Kineosporia babensis]